MQANQLHLLAVPTDHQPLTPVENQLHMSRVVVCSCLLGAQALGVLRCYKPGSATTSALPEVNQHKLKAICKWLLLVLGLEVPRQSQTVTQKSQKNFEK